MVLICAVFILPYKADTTSSLKDFIVSCRGDKNQGYTIIIQYGGAAYNLRTQEVEEGRSEVQSHPWLHRNLRLAWAT